MDGQEGHAGHRERMKNRFLRYGLTGFEDHNVLELLLFFAQPRIDTNLTAHRLMDTFGSLDAVFDADPAALMAVPGVGKSAAVLIRLVPEAARRYLIAKEDVVGELLVNSEAAGRYLLPRFFGRLTETVYIVCMDAKLQVLDCRMLASGGPISAPVSTRQVVETALAQNAANVILAHNHTSGIALPSQEDKDITLRLRAALALVDITLVDHIIVAGSDFVSLADSGLFQEE